MKEYIKTVPLATFILLGLFFCGGLNLIGYWGTFDIKMQEWVTIWEIPKASLFPLSVSLAFYFFGEIVIYTAKKVNYLLSDSDFSEINVSSKFSNTVVLVSSILIVCLYYPAKHTIVYWIFSISLLFLFLQMKILHFLWDNNKFKISEEFARPFATFIVAVPISMFLLGKKEALEVYNNSKINIINKKAIANITDTSAISSMKFLGALGDKFIVSDLKNERIFIINQNGGEGVELLIPKELPLKRNGKPRRFIN